MDFFIILVLTIAGCFVLKKPLKKYSWAFYIVALALDVLFITGACYALPKPVWSVLYLLVQKCTLPLALFTVVMFIGVFPKDSKVRQALQPIRGELSVLAWLLCLAHVTVYLMSYAPRVLSGGLISTSVIVSLVLALVILVLLVVLGVTSFKTVKRAMNTAAWKKVQLLAYPFWLLVYVHLMLMLAPSALGGGQAAITSVIVYTIVFGAYAVLRPYAFLRAKNAAPLTTGADN